MGTVLKNRGPSDAVSVAAFGVACSATCTLLGWLLSLAGALGAAGAIATLIAAAAAGGWAARATGARLRLRWRPRRWRRVWPAGFLLLAVAALAGGLLYDPSNIDALTYRLPRALHWLDAGRWHWIATGNLRMNYSATGQEWLLAPLLALHVPARVYFLPDALAFLLLPGLVFSVLRGFGSRGRVAWRWMWLAPAALGLALQAGSLGNDLLGVVWFLAALVFAQRARARPEASWFVLAAIALGLATNIKASNLALVPMGLVLLWSARRGPMINLAALALGLAVSALPSLALNTIHTGHWSGDPQNLTAVRPGSPAAALVGNTALTVAQNLAPPFFPGAGHWNDWADAFQAQRWRAHFGATGFPRFTLRLGELPQEEWAGAGLLLCLLLGIECLHTLIIRGRNHPRAKTPLALWAGFAGIVVYALVMGSEMPARLLLPFYVIPLAFVASRAPARGHVVWSCCAALALATALLAVVLTPARPLFPAKALWGWAAQRWPGSEVVARGARVYEVYARRPDMLAPLRSALAPDDTAVGFLATDDDSEWSLWQPLGSRRVVPVTSAGDARARGLRVLVIHDDNTTYAAAAATLDSAGFTIVAEYDLLVKAARPSEYWLVARAP